MTQATSVPWDSFLADVNEFQIRNCERNAKLNNTLDNLLDLIATHQRFLGLPVENEVPTESGVFDNDEDEDDKNDAPWDRVLTAISKFRIENREMHATQHKKLDDLGERMTSMEQFLGRPIEDEAPMESCVYDNEDDDDNDDDAPFHRVRAAYDKLLTENDELFDIKFKKFGDLMKRLRAIVP